MRGSRKATGDVAHEMAMAAPAAKGRTGPELQAKSRHKHLATLGVHVRLGEERSARITAENDEHNRRRP